MRRTSKTKTIKVSPPEMARTALRDTAVVRIEAPLTFVKPSSPKKKGKRRKA